MQTNSTIGVEFATHNVKIEDVLIRAQIWDTAGQERYRAITNTYYRQAIGVLLVYDISRRPTFESIGKWLQEVRDHADEKVAIILVGNKSDLEDKRAVSQAEAARFAQQQCKQSPISIFSVLPNSHQSRMEHKFGTWCE
eukprot:Macronucleus_7307.p1 GENE.Macronucleus_7307~~Macronucleus_7307.p1  ORF type:complete len:139 (+),score=7.50 Macronucleus_7307:1-417(+)